MSSGVGRRGPPRGRSSSAEIGVVIASAALVIAFVAQIINVRTARWNSSRDCLWHFNDGWEKIEANRDKAWTAIKAMPPFAENADVDTVLDFYDGMAFMGNRGRLDDELAWSYWYAEADAFYRAAEPYIAWAVSEDDDAPLWCELKPWMAKLRRVEGRYEKRLPNPRPKAPAAPTTPTTVAEKPEAPQDAPKSS